MASVIIVIHLMVVVALVGTVLLQKSEGGALGIGGGGGGMGARGQANVLTRTTTGLAIAFFTTSMILSMIARGPEQGSILDAASPTGEAVPAAPSGPATTEDLLRQFDQQGGRQPPSGPQDFAIAVRRAPRPRLFLSLSTGSLCMAQPHRARMAEMT